MTQTMSSKRGENDALLKKSVVVATSAEGAPLEKTVDALLESDDAREAEQG